MQMAGQNSAAPTRSASAAAARALAVLRMVRPRHWAKNVLVFAPVAGAHRWTDREAMVATATSFLAFSLAASSGYVLNDAVDVDADRLHALKGQRPFASGMLPMWSAWIIGPMLGAAALALALTLPWRFGLLLAVYVAATIAYSLGLKRKLIVDVMLLAGLYTARIFGGSLASGIPVSEWLATFSMFFFLSLAFLKRASELHGAPRALPGRSYTPEDREAVLAMGTSAGYLATLVLALYVSSREVRRLYPHPEWLWGLCPLVLYWLSRLWIQARRGRVQEDPLLYASRYAATWAVVVSAAALVVMASL
jgi:4-hydroxybenzoate polyprenyltransferase